MSDKKTISDLRQILFDTIDAVKNGTMDIERAKMVGELSQVMVNTAKVEVDMVKATGGKESQFLAPAPEPLPPGITGTYTHRLR